MISLFESPPSRINNTLLRTVNVFPNAHKWLDVGVHREKSTTDSGGGTGLAREKPWG